MRSIAYYRLPGECRLPIDFRVDENYDEAPFRMRDTG
jgi:hypothetical protein